jgi:hypothetical protein
MIGSETAETASSIRHKIFRVDDKFLENPNFVVNLLY